MAYINVFPNL